MSPAHLVSGNELTLLQNGVALFPQLCADIDAAKHSVYLESYIFAADESGHLVGRALRRAAERGVTVRVLLDGFGSAELPASFEDELRKSGSRCTGSGARSRLYLQAQPHATAASHAPQVGGDGR